MFERFTEKARRVIFFARYEASQYGNSYIQTEHSLLGLCREDLALRELLKDTGPESQIRAEIERRIVRGERISTSVEIPFSAESKQALQLAAEEARRLAHRYVGTEHILLGMLRIEGSWAAQLLRTRGVGLEELRKTLSTSPQMAIAREPVKPPLPVLEDFLQGLKWHDSGRLLEFLAGNAQMVDVFGKRWNHEEITKNFVNLFAPYAKKNATHEIEEIVAESADHLVVMMLWKNALVASMERVWMHRMTVVMSRKSDHWAIVSIQMAPVQPT